MDRGTGLVLRGYRPILIFSLLAGRVIKIFKCILFRLRSRYAKNLREIAPVAEKCVAF